VRLLAHGGAVEPGGAAPLGDRGIGEHDLTDHLVVVLHRVGKAQGQLMEVIQCRHTFDRAPVTFT